MTRFLRKLLATVAVLSLLSGSAPAPAQQDHEEDEKSTQPPFDPSIGKRLNRAIEELDAGENDEARAILATIHLHRASPYEVSRVEQMLASIDQSEEKYGAAREHLVKALASGGLNDKEISATRFQIAKLYFAEENWAEGVRTLNEWLATEPKPSAVAYYTLAAAYYQLGDLEAAVGPAQKAVELGGDVPQESWLQLLLALRARREEYSLAFPTLMQLIERLPDNELYWMQAASVSLSMDRYDTATAVLQLAHTAGFLNTGEEIQRLAELLAHAGIPYRAARILSEGIRGKQVPESSSSYEFLGNCWIAAREYDKAIEPLGRAGELADNGEPYVRLAEVYFQREDWNNAAAALDRALGKGNLQRIGNAQLLMGLALYNQKRVRDARAWFERARAHNETRAQAEGWLRQTEAELDS